MQRREAVAEANARTIIESLERGIGIERRQIAAAAQGVIDTWILRDLQGRAARGVTRVFDWNNRIERIVGAAQEDEEQLFAVQPERRIGGEGLFHHERNVRETCQRAKRAELHRGGEEIAAGLN